MRMRSLRLAQALGLLASLVVFGSGIATADDQLSSITVTRARDKVSTLPARQGLAEIRAGNYRQASRLFNAALKFEPENAHLHFLNGLTYHLLYAQGHRANLELAETAYSLALQVAPEHALAAYYNGLLQIENRQYGKAQAALAHALLIERDDPAILQALAVASYYAHDLGMAIWAVERSAQTRDPDAETLRSAAIIYAAAGRVDDAMTRSSQLKRLAGENGGDYVGKRVRNWLSFHEAQRGKLYRTANPSLTPESLSDDSPAPAGIPAPPDAPAIVAASAAPPADAGILRNWSDCPQGTTPANASYSSSSYASDSSVFRDETAILQALPSPCDRKALPRMALLDTAIISTYENVTSDKGINLLDGLRLMLGASFVDTNEPNGLGRVKTFRRTASLDNLGGSAAALAYSLNIANAGDEWNQVLARPTLLALDRQPSTFFSGNSLSTTVQGAFGGGTLVEHPAGISLSVTPTFVDDEQILLAVRVARSYFINEANLHNDTVVKSRNAVSANVLMKMGETLIISGLTERQTNEAKSGVPLLKEIPLLQYLFSSESKNDLTQSILVMITPRPPVTGANAPSARRGASTPEQQSSLKELREEITAALGPGPNLDTVFADMQDNRLYREFRSGDLRPEDWRRAPALERTLKQLAEFLYY